MQRDNTALRENVAALTRQNGALRREADLASESARASNRRTIELDSQLAAVKSFKSSQDAQGIQLFRELNVAKRELVERQQRETGLMAELASLRETIATASSAGAASAANVAAGKLRIAELEQQLAAASHSQLKPSASPLQTAAQAYTVLRVGPRDSFVVIDYGSDQGAQSGHLISLRRGTSTVAYVRISDARPNFSIAQVLPDSLKGQLQPGDFVVLPQ